MKTITIQLNTGVDDIIAITAVGGIGTPMVYTSTSSFKVADGMKIYFSPNSSPRTSTEIAEAKEKEDGNS